MRKRIKRLIIWIVIGLTSISIMSFAGSLFSKDFHKLSRILAEKRFHNSINLLFIQLADSGSLASAKSHSGCYWLTLNNLHKRVIFFSDQPKRTAGRLTTAQFMQTWKHDRIQPNVAIEAFAINGNAINEVGYVATLSQAKYNARQNSIRYLACPINNSKMRPIAKLSSIDLFFDPFHPWPP